MSIDPRSLGALRIALGLLLLLDLLRRALEIDLWYTNAGLLPNHRLLWRPATPYQISYLYSLFTLAQVRAAFLVSGAIYLGFLFGYRTRLMHVLSWFALLSLHTRATMLCNGGDYVFCSLLLWSMFLPLGARFSIDRFIVRARNGAELLPTPQPVVSLAALALLLQLTVIYLFNALQKTGVTWRDGSAVYYLLHQARMVTMFGLWVRDHVPFGMLRASSYSAVVIEYSLPLLILCPWFRWPRRLAIVLIWGLHANIALVANLGLFSPVMMAFSTILLSAEDWPHVERMLQRQQFTQMSQRLLAKLRAVGEWLARAAPQWPVAPPSKTKWWLRELTVAALVLLAFSQLIVENQRIPACLKLAQPSFVSAAVSYLRLNQGWSMFAPDAPRNDMWLVVDAVTTDGRHIDPLNMRGSAVVDAGLRTVPDRLGFNAFLWNYTSSLPDEDLLHDSLSEWILQHHRRTKRREDRIVRFEVFLVERDSPKPGESVSTNQRSSLFLSGEAER